MHLEMSTAKRRPFCLGGRWVRITTASPTDQWVNFQIPHAAVNWSVSGRCLGISGLPSASDLGSHCSNTNCFYLPAHQMTQYLKKQPILSAKQILNLTWMKIKKWIGHNAHDGTNTPATLYMSCTTNIDIKARISNYIHIKLWDAITQQFHIFNDGNVSENATSQDLMLRRPDAI